MKNDERSQYTTRHRVIELLSDAELASVSSAATAMRLENGDEYVNLERLDQGVRRAFEDTTPMGRALPRKAVQEQTWRKIVSELAGSGSATLHSDSPA